MNKEKNKKKIIKTVFKYLIISDIIIFLLLYPFINNYILARISSILLTIIFLNINNIIIKIYNKEIKEDKNEERKNKNYINNN